MSNRKQISWRRNKTEDLLIKGNNQIQIAQILQVSEGTVSNDVTYLREQSRKNMENHLNDKLPREYENCLAGINQVLKISWDIATKDCQAPSININSGDHSISTSKVDDKTKLQALALVNDCYKYKMDLVTNGVVLADAVKFVLRKKEEVQMIAEDVNKASVKSSPTDQNSDVNVTKNKVF